MEKIEDKIVKGVLEVLESLELNNEDIANITVKQGNEIIFTSASGDDGYIITVRKVFAGRPR